METETHAYPTPTSVPTKPYEPPMVGQVALIKDMKGYKKAVLKTSKYFGLARYPGGIPRNLFGKIKLVNVSCKASE